jgi:hypothetical protein
MLVFQQLFTFFKHVPLLMPAAPNITSVPLLLPMACQEFVFWTMFVERLANSSDLFTLLVRWHASAVSLPPSDAMLAELTCPLNDATFCIHWE